MDYGTCYRRYKYSQKQMGTHGEVESRWDYKKVEIMSGCKMI